jgi:hypothetical protein
MLATNHSFGDTLLPPHQLGRGCNTGAERARAMDGCLHPRPRPYLNNPPVNCLVMLNVKESSPRYSTPRTRPSAPLH